jgi:hypothetical protein
LKIVQRFLDTPELLGQLMVRGNRDMKRKEEKGREKKREEKRRKEKKREDEGFWERKREAERGRES